MIESSISCDLWYGASGSHLCHQQHHLPLHCPRLHPLAYQSEKKQINQTLSTCTTNVCKELWRHFARHFVSTMTSFGMAICKAPWRHLQGTMTSFGMAICKVSWRHLAWHFVRHHDVIWHGILQSIMTLFSHGILHCIIMSLNVILQGIRTSFLKGIMTSVCKVLWRNFARHFARYYDVILQGIMT